MTSFHSLENNVGLLHEMLDEDSVVAQALGVGFRLEAEALVWQGASVGLLVGASPIRAAFVARFSSPAGLADAEVGSPVGRGVAEPVVAVQVAGRPVAEVALPSFVADAGVRMINAFSVLTTGHLLAEVAVISRPSAAADALVRTHALAVGAIGANRCVAIGPFPAWFTIALECI